MEIEEDFEGGQIVCIDAEDFYYNILLDWHKKSILVSVYLNLEDSFEPPAREFKIEWFEYMFYDMKEDWMFDK